eukprot:scaffold1821_cov344-Pavlova_lutheri.AAC.51
MADAGLRRADRRGMCTGKARALADGRIEPRLAGTSSEKRCPQGPAMAWDAVSDRPMCTGCVRLPLGACPSTVLTDFSMANTGPIGPFHPPARLPPHHLSCIVRGHHPHHISLASRGDPSMQFG